MWSRWEVTSTLSFSRPPFIFQSSEPWLVLWRTPLITSSTQVVSLNRLPTYELLRWSQYSRGQVHCPPGSMHSPRESETQRHQDLTPLRASSSKHSLSCPDGKGQPLVPSGLLCMEAIYFGFEERTKLWLQSSLARHQLATESSAVLHQVSHDGQVL